MPKTKLSFRVKFIVRSLFFILNTIWVALCYYIVSHIISDDLFIAGAITGAVSGTILSSVERTIKEFEKKKKNNYLLRLCKRKS